jgi:hypothetical protein
VPSPALDTFNGAVDASSLGAAAKAQIKTQGTTLYGGAVDESIAVLMDAIDAARDAGATGQDLALLNRLYAICQEAQLDPDPYNSATLPTRITNITDAERMWAKGLYYLISSDNMAEASDRWDVLMSRHDSPAVRTRLLALRDLITDKLGA